MSAETFQIAYDGEAIANGSIDVRVLSPALLSLGELVKNANEILNGDAAESSLRVKSDFRTGSFEVNLVLNQTLLEATKNLFAAHPVTDAAGIAALLFGGIKKAPDVIESVMKVYKTLKGEKAAGVVLDMSTHTTIITAGSGNTYNVENKAAQLYNDDRIIKSLEGVLKPVSEQKMDFFEVRNNEGAIDRIDKEDLPSRLTDGSPNVRVVLAAPEDRLTNTRELILKVRKVNFDKGRWTFWDGNSKIGATVEDSGFNDRVGRGEEPFYSDDTLHVLMRTSQRIGKDDKLESSHVIERVFSHTHAVRAKTLNLEIPD